MWSHISPSSGSSAAQPRRRQGNGATCTQHIAGQASLEERACREPVDRAKHQFQNKLASEWLESIKQLEAASIAQLGRGLQISPQMAFIENECRRLDALSHPGIQRQPRHVSTAHCGEAQLIIASARGLNQILYGTRAGICQIRHEPLANEPGHD